MDRINKRLENSELNRQQLIYDDAQSKAKKNIYEKLDAIKQQNISIEAK